ncbi:MAG: hypothetical protein ABJA81_09490, partial [Nocardioidaceae bacterium]
ALEEERIRPEKLEIVSEPGTKIDVVRGLVVATKGAPLKDAEAFRAQNNPDYNPWLLDDLLKKGLVPEMKQDNNNLLVSVLQAYGVARVISSDAVRCVDTVLPYVHACGARLKLDRSLSEQGYEAAAMRKRVTAALASSRRIVICSHRPVLPHLFEALGVEPVRLEPAGMVVVHRRAGHVVSLEQHPHPL